MRRSQGRIRPDSQDPLPARPAHSPRVQALAPGTTQRQLNYFPQATPEVNPKLRDWSLNPEKLVAYPTIDYIVTSFLTDSAPLPVENSETEPKQNGA
jgi:hypothetical protein